MGDKIQMTEKQAKEFIHNMFYSVTLHTEVMGSCVSSMDEIISQMKEKGYIIKTDLESARENWLKWRTSDRHFNRSSAEQYIKALEKEIDRLTKG